MNVKDKIKKWNRRCQKVSSPQQFTLGNAFRSFSSFQGWVRVLISVEDVYVETFEKYPVDYKWAVRKEYNHFPLFPHFYFKMQSTHIFVFIKMGNRN